MYNVHITNAVLRAKETVIHQYSIEEEKSSFVWQQFKSDAITKQHIIRTPKIVQ